MLRSIRIKKIRCPSGFQGTPLDRALFSFQRPHERSVACDGLPEREVPGATSTRRNRAAQSREVPRAGQARIRSDAGRLPSEKSRKIEGIRSDSGLPRPSVSRTITLSEVAAGNEPSQDTVGAQARKAAPRRAAESPRATGKSGLRRSRSAETGVYVIRSLE